MIACPKCQKTFDVEPHQIAEARVRLFCDRCKTIFGLSDLGGSKRVLVVHGSDAMSDIVSQIVKDSGWIATRAKNGHEALSALESERFRLVVVDVATEAPYAFELVPTLKQRPGLHVLLLASVYDKTAYKRRPNTLYGADAYLEQHHLPDKLPIVLSGLGGDALGGEEDAALIEQKRDALRRAADEQLGNGGRVVTPGDVPDQDQVSDVGGRARTLAKKLVLDISLYHEEAFLRGLAAGDMRVALGAQIVEAKRFLGERMPPPLGQKDADAFIERALDELARARRPQDPGR
ncbi:MAG: zinc-ribbon domain-containing protein [Deltaproteobacteria bacterium]|nr:zinc-ribbon domain-containing protein [Deltaproteobacteria bacterium]